MIRKSIESNTKILQMFRFGLQFWIHLLEELRHQRFFIRDLFIGTSGGYPLGLILASSGAPLV